MVLVVGDSNRCVVVVVVVVAVVAVVVATAAAARVQPACTRCPRARPVPVEGGQTDELRNTQTTPWVSADARRYGAKVARADSKPATTLATEFQGARLGRKTRVGIPVVCAGLLRGRRAPSIA